MHIWGIVPVLVVSGSAVFSEKAISQELPPIVSKLLRLDRGLAEICEVKKDRLDDDELKKWTRRRELSNLLTDDQRHELKQKSQLTKECHALIEKRAEASQEPTTAVRLWLPPLRESYLDGILRWRAHEPLAAPGRDLSSFSPTLLQTLRERMSGCVGIHCRPPNYLSTLQEEMATFSPNIKFNRVSPDTLSVLRERMESRQTTLFSLFKWPLPPPSTRRKFSPDVFQDLPPAKTAGEVAKRLEQIMGIATFDSFAYYPIKGGFALATRIEKLDTSTGKPLSGEARWGSGPEYVTSGYVDYFYRIFATSRPKGFYRAFVFALTTDPRMGARIPAVELHGLAEVWGIQGDPSLSSEIESLPVSAEHDLIVMVYEFEVTKGGPTKHYKRSRWSLDHHLSSLRVLLKPQR